MKITYKNEKEKDRSTTMILAVIGGICLVLNGILGMLNNYDAVFSNYLMLVFLFGIMLSMIDIRDTFNRIETLLEKNSKKR